MGFAVTVVALVAVVSAGTHISGPPATWSGAGASSATLPLPSGGSSSNWSAVQVAFLLETTAYDGFYDATAGDPGYDACAGAPNSIHVCNESNGGPFFVIRAGQIASAIAAGHPGTKVTFGLADFFATADKFDDGDGSAFHVDVRNFTAAATFQSAVNLSFRAHVLGGGGTYADSDLSDNILHSSSVTALYGALGTRGFNWSTKAHHVVVLIGSTAPRSQGYSVNYSVSASDYSAYCRGSCQSPNCEPQYTFGAGLKSPWCEGWARSSNGIANDSIAWLARSGPLCARSLGGNCTVDTISLYNGVTDPLSKQWPAGRTGGGPNGTIVRGDIYRILTSGCALSAATGGSWDGPSFFSCPNNLKGSLRLVAVGSAANPSLLSALTGIGFG
ncbi:MAG TPA: hypothetical protein VFF67_10520 [Thermoplasmata archaeon]|nr:hypothetical protein [Thermoplasmata archaeon]